MVVFPQAPELSTGRPQFAKNHVQGTPQAKSQSATAQFGAFHISTTPYYN